MNLHEIPVASEPEDLVVDCQSRIKFIEDNYIEYNYQPAIEPDNGNQYQRDRTGSKRRESKTANRKKAKAARSARKAQR